MNFLQNMWLWALPLIALPPIIHYLLRRKYQNVSWGAIDLLRRTLKKNRRRHRLEEWLLIFLRVFIFLLLILSLAQPQFQDENLEVSFRRNPVLIFFDQSLSTSRLEGLKTVHERLKESCLDYIAGLDRNRNVFLMVTPHNETIQGKQNIIQAIEQSRPMWANGNLQTAIDQAEIFLKDRQVLECDVEIFSDFQKSDFESIKSWPSNWNLYSNTIQLVQKENRALKKFLPGKGFPTLFRDWFCDVEISGDPGPVHVTLTDQNAITFQQEVRIPQSGTLVFQIPHVFETQGWHELVVTISDDVYMFDNKRYLSVYVPEQPRILILANQNPQGYKKDEIEFFERALDPYDKFELTTSQYLPEKISDYDIYILNDFSAISKSMGQIIWSQIQQGSVLVVFLGANAQPNEIVQAFPSLPKINKLKTISQSFVPDANGFYRRWHSYFRPFQFKNYFTLGLGGLPQLFDSDRQVVLSTASVDQGHWLLAGFGPNSSHGDWIGSPIYVGLIRSVVTKFSQARFLGDEKVIDVKNPQWNQPGFYLEDQELSFVNPPQNESDLEVYAMDSSKSVIKTHKAAPQPIGLTLLLFVFAFLFIETIWHLKAA